VKSVNVTDERSETIVATPEELISVLDEADAAQLLRVQPFWLVEGLFAWAREDVKPLDEPTERPEVGLPLVVPGTRYAITLTATRWGLAKAATALLANLVLANPFNWALGMALASSQTVLTLLENIEQLTDQEHAVLLAISRAKRAYYSGMRRDPTRREIQEHTDLDETRLNEVLASLGGKGLVREDRGRVHIVV
jgi:hypothetical protein